MSFDPGQFELSADQQAELADLSAATGKPWKLVLQEALASYRDDQAGKEHSGPRGDSFFDAASRRGLIGCLQGGPPDLSSNPNYLERFGQADG